ncbi:TetR family transcriptional regulator [Streptomyces sp. NPDC004787]|uniref:TetR/AcrR family transcriptional regulator n=1 Tax=Streptomyces sp. NPDC004787 TaxID=3154291 RepID=UPI0033BA5149
MTTARRSDATRAAILHAARERFAADGYERATIRAIARDAGIDASMVMRYYGNKEGLFAAASAIELELPELGSLPARHIGTALVTHFLDRWERDDVLTGMLRVGVTNDSGAERMQRLFAEQIGPVVAGVCPDPSDAPRRAGLVASQILGMALTRYVLRFRPVAEMSREDVIAWLAPTVQRYLAAEGP